MEKFVNGLAKIIVGFCVFLAVSSLGLLAYTFAKTALNFL